MWGQLSDHCPEYENITMEEKLLVDMEMRKWYERANIPYFCAPIFIFREVERRIIEELKKKNERRKNDK